MGQPARTWVEPGTGASRDAKKQERIRHADTRGTLQKDLGNADVTTGAGAWALGQGLAKICERHRIPRPPRGYWAKRQFGLKPRQTQLPEEEDQAKATITLCPGTAPDRSVDRRAEPTIEILVPETLAEVHPLVARTEKSLRSARPDKSGLVSPRAKKAMRVSVAPDSEVCAKELTGGQRGLVSPWSTKLDSSADRHFLERVRVVLDDVVLD